MEICKSRPALKAFQAAQRIRGHTLALIATMGALHDGHLSLVRRAQDDGHATLVTIFVNPTQFAANEDLATYPQPLEADIAALQTLGVDALFLPPQTLMYPRGEGTRVRVDALAKRWEGIERPHFFTGVATVVTKLLIVSAADVAYFGEKDYQQLQVIRRLADDLLIATRIIPCPIVRADDGLALSSRNAYLRPKERRLAPVLYQALQAARMHILGGQDVGQVVAAAQDTILSSGFDSVSYCAYVNAQTLNPSSKRLLEGSGRLLAAASLGGTRLIDNLAV